jgi:hypothetical protein
MANAQCGNVDQNFIDKRRFRSYDSNTMAEQNNYDYVYELRARLAALSASTFTAARLDAMTVNDMVYALRLHSADAAGV